MKLLFGLIMSVTVLALAASVMAGERGYLATENEPLYGTWVNMDYTCGPYQKVVLKADGTFESFYNIDSKNRGLRGRYLITGRWNDAGGNIMYKTHFVGNWGEEGYALHKISDSGKTREGVWDPYEPPKEINPNLTSYTIYFRRE
jgi:hypothetical protein